MTDTTQDHMRYGIRHPLPGKPKIWEVIIIDPTRVNRPISKHTSYVSAVKAAGWLATR